MIQQGSAARQACDWQTELARAIRDPLELAQLLDLDPAALGMAPAAAAQFPLRVPRPYLARMRRGDPADPLLLQVLPGIRELADAPGYVADPLREREANPVPGLIHKYHGRVLLLASPACAVHCRYCFRRHFDYAANTPGRRQWQPALDYIRRQPSIAEVIYSGGDPLAAGDGLLAWLTAQVAAIPHVRRLRIHTRLPVVIPARVDARLLAWLGDTGLQCSVVLHINHANEIDAEVAAAVGRLRGTGALLLNQSVLLQGINDSVDRLAALSEGLFSIGVLPYYLHLLDRVQGAAHFAVTRVQAVALHRALLARLPGYLAPRLVEELPALPYKAPVGATASTLDP
ncbi:MAG: EF-P beta-lysylation protein EpmB [Pseudomonadota bacterium]|jgi:L-lysine 2,3-aminomutase